MRCAEGGGEFGWPIPGVVSPERGLAAAAMALPPGAPRSPVLRRLQGPIGDGSSFAELWGCYCAWGICPGRAEHGRPPPAELQLGAALAARLPARREGCSWGLGGTK